MAIGEAITTVILAVCVFIGAFIAAAFLFALFLVAIGEISFKDLIKNGLWH